MILHTGSLLMFYSADGITQEGLQALVWLKVTVGLRPLVVWMSNILELVQFIQLQLPLMLECKTQKGKQHIDEERSDNEMEHLG